VPPRPGFQNGQKQFDSFRASSLFCPRCQKAQPVTERLLLILPDGELFEYVCQFCWTQLGKRKVEQERPALIL
jgi:hypothetical protein